MILLKHKCNEPLPSFKNTSVVPHCLPEINSYPLAFALAFAVVCHFTTSPFLLPLLSSYTGLLKALKPHAGLMQSPQSGKSFSLCICGCYRESYTVPHKSIIPYSLFQ